MPLLVLSGIAEPLHDLFNQELCEALAEGAIADDPCEKTASFCLGKEEYLFFKEGC